MKVKILIASFGFDAGRIYEAVEHDAGYWVKNQHLGKLIPKHEAEVVR